VKNSCQPRLANASDGASRRNTAAAIALAALHVRHAARGALCFCSAADHYIANPSATASSCAQLWTSPAAGPYASLAFRDAPGNGFRLYRAHGDALDSKVPVYAVRRFTEKPRFPLRKCTPVPATITGTPECFWRASTFLENLDRHLPKPSRLLNRSGKHRRE